MQNAATNPLNPEVLARWTADYRQAVGDAWQWLGPESDARDTPRVPLTDVFVLLEALHRPPPSPTQKEYPADLPPEAARWEHAGMPPPFASPPEPLPPEAARGEHAGMPLPSAPPPEPMPLGRALQECRHMVLLGEPGSGKSTTLQFIGLCFARAGEGWPQQRLGLPEDRLPILLRLPDVARELATSPSSTLLDCLAGEVRQRLQIDKGSACALIARWAENDGLLVLLDGPDEVESDRRGGVRDAVLKFAHSPIGEKARLVVASRIAGYILLGGPFRDYQLRPLTGPEDRKIFLKNWLRSLRSDWGDEEAGQQAERLLAALEGHPALRRLLGIPLLLRLCAEIYAGGREIARSRADLYRRYFEVLLDRAEGRGLHQKRRGALLDVAEALAWHLHLGGDGRPEACVQALLNRLAKNREEAEAFLDDLRAKAGLIVRLDGRLAFSHTTLQEALVAERLKKAWERNRRGAWRFLRPRLHREEWREPLLLLAGGLEEAERFIRKVERAGSPSEPILRRDRRLALAMFAERGQVGSLIRALKDGDWVVRRAAAEALGGIGDPWAVEPLIRALKDEDWRVRQAAAEALGAIGDRQAVEPLIQALKDDEGDVRQAAAKALGRIGDSQAVEPLIRALKGEDWWVRRAAAEALGRIGDWQAVEPLIQALKDADWDVRQAAAKALREIGDLRGIEPLIQALKDEDKGVRRAAAEVLGEIGEPAVLPLIQALKDEDKGVRQAAAEALGKIGDPRAVKPLIRALKDEDKRVRRVAAWVLGKIGDSQVVEPLIRALKDGDWWVRQAAAWALGRIGDWQAVEPLIRALKDEDWGVRWAAAEALGRIGDWQAVERLIRALKDEDWEVRRAAAWALGAIGDRQAVEPLIRALKDEDWRVRQAAAEALGAIGDRQAVEPLIQALKDEDKGVRQAAAEALGKIGDPRAVKPFIQALKDGDWRVRWAAAEALGRIGDRQAVELLIPALKDEDWRVRQAAAEALGEIGDRRAVELLIQALKDEDWLVGQVAAEALEKVLAAAPFPVEPGSRREEINRLRSWAKQVEKMPRSDESRQVLAAIRARLERLQLAEQPAIDPLNPPPSWWKRMPVGIRMAVWAGVAGVLGYLLSLAADPDGALPHWLRIPFIFLLSGLGGWVGWRMEREKDAGG